MSTSGINVASSAGSPLSITGLASGLDTSSIIAELMEVERQPAVRLSHQQTEVQAEQTELQSIQSSLQELSFAISDFSLPSLYESSQTVTSSEPARVSAAATQGAAIGGYEVEVTRLANAAQRTFTFTSPAEEDTITIDGQEFTVKPGETAKELVRAINSDSTATVYAAALESGRVVLSSRTTGSTGEEFIEVGDGGETLSEVEGTAKEGVDAEYTVDGVAGTSSSNTVTEAIAGVTLTLGALTPTGPVTIDVLPPGPNPAAIEEQVQSFVKLYNSTVEAIEKQLNTKPPTNPQTNTELATGTLYGDMELRALLQTMRRTMYEPISGLEAGMSSLLDVGISTGAPVEGGKSSQSSIEGLLTLNASKLTEAVTTNPAGVEEMLRQWSQKLEAVVNGAGAPGGALEARISGDTERLTSLRHQIANMTEALANREKALRATYAELEAVISQNTAQSNWLTQQTSALEG